MNSNIDSPSKYQAIYDKYSNKNFKVREIEHGDYNKGYHELLSSGFNAPKVEESEFKKQIDLIKNERAPHVIIVIEDVAKKLIVASGIILIERKFIRNNAFAAHIEEVVVHTDYRKNGCGKILLETLKEIAVAEKSYKIMLDCEETVIPFYEKLGFAQNGVAMNLYDVKKNPIPITNSKL